MPKKDVNYIKKLYHSYCANQYVQVLSKKIARQKQKPSFDLGRKTLFEIFTQPERFFISFLSFFVCVSSSVDMDLFCLFCRIRCSISVCYCKEEQQPKCIKQSQAMVVVYFYICVVLKNSTPRPGLMVNKGQESKTNSAGPVTYCWIEWRSYGGGARRMKRGKRTEDTNGPPVNDHPCKPPSCPILSFHNDPTIIENKNKQRVALPNGYLQLNGVPLLIPVAMTNPSRRTHRSVRF